MDFLEPHAICLSPEPLLIWLLVVFNAGIAVAYFTIPVAMLLYLKVGRPPIIAYLFAIFILGCGGTHVMQVITMYVGGSQYFIEAFVCGLTFVASAATALVLMVQGPKLKQYAIDLMTKSGP